MVRKYHSPPPGSVLGQTCLAMKLEHMEQNLFLKYGLRACGYGRLSDVPKDFVAPNVKPVPKPIVADSVDEDIDIEVDIFRAMSQKMKIETRHLKVLKVPSSKLG